MSKIEINMLLGDELHAALDSEHVPAVGDYVTVRGGTYRIIERTWIFERIYGSKDSVVLSIVPWNQEKNA